jgi:sugar O-acyltransferase (sialic acid O-acetyltransferase NeuD family)
MGSHTSSDNNGTGRSPLLIFPCNGNAIEALDSLGHTHHLLGFVDDTPEKQGTVVHGYTVYSRDALARWPQAPILAVAGSPASYLSRRQIIEGLGLSANRFATLIHPTASISPLARVGRNVLIMAGVVITSNAVIGDHVCVLPNTVIHHDVVVGSWSLIGSNVTIAGGTAIGDNCYIGSGSSVINNIRVGERALVGLGSNVVRSVNVDAKIAGNPAREISSTTRKK